MPFALPPIGVLHGMLEIFLIFNVHNKVLFPNFADDNAASTPAWPLPIIKIQINHTINFNSVFHIFYSISKKIKSIIIYHEE